MKKNLVITLLTLFSICIFASSFAQNDEKSTIIGYLNSDEEAMNLVADSAGNTYVCGRMETKGLIVKQNSLQQVLWSKVLSFTTTSGHQVSVDFLDLKADTVFGCGRIHLSNTAGGTGIGSFYFKMNAQTGMLYWSKFETNGQNYLSTMRYANGKYLLVGGQYGANNRGRVMAVSSQTGNIIWQTPYVNYNFLANTTNHETIFSGATEVLNGKMYITGSTYSYTPGNFDKSVPILIGITETGNIFLHRYFDFPQASDTDYIGLRIEHDTDNNLLIGVFHKYGTTPGNISNCVLKCDTMGAVIFSKFYNVNSGPLQWITHLNETPTSYTLLGYVSSPNRAFVMNISKTGTLQKCVSIIKPNVFYHPLPYSSSWKVSGNSTFMNGKHYFPAAESTISVPQLDINKIILDENLDYAEDCSQITEIFPTTINVPVSVFQLVPIFVQIPLAYTSGGVLEDQLFINPCSNVSLNLLQTQNCSEMYISAALSGFTDPTFYWSNGANNDADTITVNTTDTIIVRVVDTKCCELTDTIVPVFVPNTFLMSLPNDTLVCLQNGSSYTVSPVFSGANGAATYLWSDNSTGPSLSILQSGTYWVEISDNCSSQRDSITIEVNSAPIIGNTSVVEVCTGDFPITLNPTVSAGASVLWDNGVTTIARVVNSPGLYSISATNYCGTVTAIISVIQVNPPDVSLIASIDSCIQNGNTILLSPTLSNVTTILWSDGSSGTQLDVANTGTYTIYASNMCGIDSATCMVTINYYPELNLPAVLDTCFDIGVGFSYTVQGSGGSYQWSSGSQTASEWISQEGIYTVTLVNQCGSIMDTMQVRRFAIPDLNFPEDSISVCQKKFPVSQLYIETNYDLEILAPYHGTVEYFIEETGWYGIHAFNGCWDRWDSIYVDLQEETFYFPNSFTPNGDSNNESLAFKGENVVIRNIRIFNRWGEEVFTETGGFNGWDGKYQGENCPDGIYIVQLIYEDCFGIPTEFTGHLNLIR